MLVFTAYFRVEAAAAVPWSFTNLTDGFITPTKINGVNQGIISAASSTIGNGTQQGGLTINGGATTTGSSLFIGTSTQATTTNRVLNSTVILGAGGYPMTSAGIVSAVATFGNATGTIFIADGAVTMNNPVDFTGKTGITILCNSRNSIFKIPQSSLGNFGFSYMLENGSHITIKNCTMDGNYRNYVAPGASQGGSMAPGDHWLVDNVMFLGSNYFSIFTGPTSIDDNFTNIEFAGAGAGSDNIGGGGGVNVNFDGIVWHNDINGNAIDQTGGNGYSFKNGWVYGNNNIYYEGLSSSTIDHIHSVAGGGISVLSDNGYAPLQGHNSVGVKVTNSYLSGGGSIGYQVISTTTTGFFTNGGDFTAENNTIDYPSNSGILIGMSHGSDNNISQWGYGIRLINNHIHNPNVASSSSFNTGIALINPGCINVTQGFGIVVQGNTCTDDRTNSQMKYGIQIGQTNGANAVNEPNHVVVSGNEVSGAFALNTHIESSTFTNDYNEQTQTTLQQNGTVTIPTGTLGINNNSPDTNYAGTIQATTTFDGIFKFLDHTGNPTWHMRLSSGGLDFVETNVADARLFLKAGGGVGIDNTGSNLYSLSTANPLNIGSTTATSTFANGINLTHGCVTYNGGSCIGTTNGTVTSIATNNGITGGTITTSGTIGLATISQGVLANIGNASTIPTSNATSSLFTGTVGQVDYFASSGGLVGTSSLFISTAGFVGIDNTNPSKPLTIKANSSSDLIQLRDSTNADKWHINLSAGTLQIVETGVATRFSIAPTGGNTTIVGPISATSWIGNFTFGAGGSPAIISTDAAKDITFAPNGEKMRITQTGSLGIGTTTPYAQLSINNSTNNIKTSLFAIASSTATATTTLFVINNIGNVGIGTSSPTAALVSVAASSTVASSGITGMVAIIAGLENTVTMIFQAIDQWGHLITSGDTPVISACGTSTVSGNDRNGTITLAGVALTSCTMTFAHAYPTAPECVVSDNTTASAADVDTTASAATFGLSVGLNSGKLFYVCQGHQ